MSRSGSHLLYFIIQMCKLFIYKNRVSYLPSNWFSMELSLLEKWMYNICCCIVKTETQKIKYFTAIAMTISRWNKKKVNSNIENVNNLFATFIFTVIISIHFFSIFLLCITILTFSIILIISKSKYWGVLNNN